MPRAPELAGRALDERYELHEMLGEGAFGRVYRGYDRRLGRPVAVKVIKPWWAEDRAWVERFQREARLLARVSDPGVVRIYDIGEAEEGPYYVAELVRGESLADRLADGPLDAEQARAIAEQLCRALASAHREGVVHCDVKPANVLLAADGTVKVGDFGVARLAEGSSQAPSATVAGTPRYMSPEQARGRAPTAATDVYSAGVVLYEMLAGRPPFRDGSPVELGLRHLQDPPPPLPPGIPPRLRRVVERALAKDPLERYPDGAAMAQALHAAANPHAPAPALVPAPGPGSADGSGEVIRGAPEGGEADPGDGSAAPAGTPPTGDATAATVAAAPRTVDLAAATRARPRATPTVVKPGGPSAPDGPRRMHHHGRRRRRVAAVAGVLLLAAAAVLLLALRGGVARTTVPDLVHLPVGGVIARAQRLHVRPAFSHRHSGQPAGIAIAQSPAPGARVGQGSTVNVVLSAGPPPVAVPGVVGEPLSSAESALSGAGLRYGTSTIAAPGSSPGTVVRQKPAAAATAPRGSTVSLSVAETPRWRTLTTFSGIDDGHSVPFRILGGRWRVLYNMSFRGTCLLLLFCGGPSAEARNLSQGGGAGSFGLEEGEAQTHVFKSGPGLYRLVVSGGRDSASWSMTVEDYY